MNNFRLYTLAVWFIIGLLIGAGDIDGCTLGQFFLKELVALVIMFSAVAIGYRMEKSGKLPPLDDEDKPLV